MTTSRNINRKAWRPTEAEVALFTQLYPDQRSAELATRFGKDQKQVYALANRLGLKKSPEFLASAASGRLSAGHQLGVEHRFVKGQPSPTKGMRLPGHGSPVTQFKPGQKPHNALPIGSLRIGVGYLQIKLYDTGYPPRDWVMYHRHVWEQAHGPIPEGHVVMFKKERVTDPALITPDVLECVSKAEQMSRNTFHQYGPEIASLVQLRGQLIRQINKRSKATHTDNGATP